MTQQRSNEAGEPSSSRGQEGQGLRNNVTGAVSYAVRDTTQDAVWAAVSRGLEVYTNAAVRDAVGAQVGNTVGVAVAGEVHDAIMVVVLDALEEMG